MKYLEFLSLKEGCTASSKSTFVKMPLCWKSRVMAHIDKIGENTNVLQGTLLHQQLITESKTIIDNSPPKKNTIKVHAQNKFFDEEYMAVCIVLQKSTSLNYSLLLLESQS